MGEATLIDCGTNKSKIYDPDYDLIRKNCKYIGSAHTPNEYIFYLKHFELLYAKPPYSELLIYK